MTGQVRTQKLLTLIVERDAPRTQLSQLTGQVTSKNLLVLHIGTRCPQNPVKSSDWPGYNPKFVNAPYWNVMPQNPIESNDWPGHDPEFCCRRTFERDALEPNPCRYIYQRTIIRSSRGLQQKPNTPQSNRCSCQLNRQDIIRSVS